MSGIRDRVKKQLSWVHTEIGTPSGNQKAYLSPDQIDQILSIPELAIVDRKAELPENPYNPNKRGFTAQLSAYSDGQQDMLKAGWVREVKNDKRTSA